MEYGYKPTTNGRKVLIACMDTGGVLQLTRVAVGKGLVSEDAELADQHKLVDYVADGTIADRRHENDRLYLTVQYSNKDHRDIPTFYLSEFIVYAINPDTGDEVDLLYATLGDYAQPVPAFQQDYPASIFNFPLILVLSDEINVSISAPAGLVTYDDLAELVRQVDITIPRTGWQTDTESNGVYNYYRDIADEKIKSRMIPQLTIKPESAGVAWNCDLSSYSQTLNGALRVYAKSIPTAAMQASLLLLSNPPYVRGDGTVDPDPSLAGVGLSYNSTTRKLNVNLGNGVSVDGSNNVQVDQQTVVTEDDLVDEDQTEADLKGILLNGSDR